jgi:NAD(P)-dependent dehydrogenase (short-subunit alcohol dehydrogenase family)
LSVVGRFSLGDRMAIITGAGTGIGAAIAVALAEAGADVVVAGRREAPLKATAESVRVIGRRALVATTDVTDPDACTALVQAAMSAAGRVDVLVNNAGAGSGYPATREPPEHFRAILDVNLNACYWMAQACGRVMQPGSSIINVSSIMALTSDGLPHAAYSASKAGLIGLTRDLAHQWSSRKGIRVNALAPGWFLDTELSEGHPEGHIERMIKHRIPLGRTGDLQELAAAAVFLASDAGSYVTGITLPVDGGALIT